MDTQGAQRAQLKQLVHKRGLQEHNEILKSEIRQLKSLAKQLTDRIEDHERRTYTGEYALFSRDDLGKWSCVGIVDPDDPKWEDDEFPAFELIIPIPDPGGMPEWEGF